MPQLATLFAELTNTNPNSRADNFYVGSSIPGKQHHIAKDGRGRPVILLSAVESTTRPASLKLKNLQVEHGVSCKIAQVSGTNIESSFTVAQCRTDDSLLQRSFVDLFDLILCDLADSPTQRDVSIAIDRISSLFVAIERPQQKAAQGIWGELFIISRSANPIQMIESWHSEFCERFDFALDNYRLEVKTSSSRSRVHHFSHEQTQPAEGVECLVASIFVEHSTGGKALGTLWDQVRDFASTKTDLRSKIDEVCFSALGNSWPQSRSLAFDEHLAKMSLEYFDIKNIPKLKESPPNNVSNIRFCSDLNDTVPWKPSPESESNTLFRSLSGK